ncbi:MAG: glycosyltransferase family 2 protein [Myxococcota bacterium]
MAPDALAIVIPTFGRPSSAARVARQVAAQVRKGDEVLVIDQSDPDAHAELCAALPPSVRVTWRPPGLPAARNAGIADTSAPLIVFFDDDVVLDGGCLEGHRAAFADPTVGGVVGRICEVRLRPNARHTTNRVSFSGRIVSRLDRTEPGPIETLKGANMSLRRLALDEVGGFDERYGGTALLEDADLSTRVARRGWRLQYAPAASVDHLHAHTGGVRAASRRESERWRFRNTAYFLAKHRGRLDGLASAATFGAIAVVRAAQLRDPSAVATWMGAWVEGWAAGRRSA